MRRKRNEHGYRPVYGPYNHPVIMKQIDGNSPYALLRTDCGSISRPDSVRNQPQPCKGDER